MTNVSDFLVEAATEQGKSIVEGRHLAIRSANRLFGFAFIMAAFGLWILPGTTLDMDLFVMKLGLSVFFGLTGAIIMHTGGDRS